MAKTKKTTSPRRPTLETDVTLRETGWFVIVDRQWFGKNTTVKNVEVRKTGHNGDDTAAEKKRTSVRKRILDCPELKAIEAVGIKAQRYLLDRCLPSYVRHGIFMVPAGMVQRTEGALTEFATEFRAAVRAAADVYNQRVDEQAASLKELFDRDDYPSASEFAGSYLFAWRWIQLGVPTELRAISPAIYKREREAEARRLQATAENIRVLLRTSAAKIMASFRDALADGAEGKTRRISSTLAARLQEFTADFPLRNMTDDFPLQAMVAEMQQLANSTDVPVIRSDEELRHQLGTTAGDIVAKLDALVETAPTRRLRFRHGR